jgi:hypothetical protein
MLYADDTLSAYYPTPSCSFLICAIPIFQYRYGIINPNGVTCLQPGSNTEYYDRVSMLQDMGYHVEILGQPIVNDQLLLAQPYINENIENDIGIRDSTKLHAFRLVEHPIVVLFDFERMFQHQLSSIVQSLMDNPNLKGYYVRTPDCDGNGNSLIDMGFLVIKPSVEEFNNIRDGYLNTPYDPELGWNSEGHNQCDGKLGLPGFLSYYFSITDGYEELDRCWYSFTADEACINKNVQQDARTATELANIIESGATSDTNLSPEATAANQAAQNFAAPIHEIRVLEVNEDNPNIGAIVIQEGSLAIMEVYVIIMLSVRMMIKGNDAQGNPSIGMVMANQFITTKQHIEQISIDPTFIHQSPVEEPAADAMIRNAVTSPVVVKQSTSICGKPTDCPPNDPHWTKSQTIACEEIHSIYFLDKRRAELHMNKISLSDQIGQYKSRSFHGYCTGPGPQNYLGLKNNSAVTTKPAWQVVCEPMVCPYGSYVTTECTCSLVDNPCEACPSGTRCQLSPVLMCIDCECGFCGSNNDSCCES